MHLAKRSATAASTNAAGSVGAGWCWVPGGRAGLGEAPDTRPPVPLRGSGPGVRETLRQEGFSDRIVLCTLDRHLPYDRAQAQQGVGRA